MDSYTFLKSHMFVNFSLILDGKRHSRVNSCTPALTAFINFLLAHDLFYPFSKNHDKNSYHCHRILKPEQVGRSKRKHMDRSKDFEPVGEMRFEKFLFTIKNMLSVNASSYSSATERDLTIRVNVRVVSVHLDTFENAYATRQHDTILLDQF